MKILIVSDTHKRLRNFDIALDRVGPWTCCCIWGMWKAMPTT